MAFHLKQGDRRPYLALQLTDADGAAVSLVDATGVVLRWTEPDGTAREEDLTVTNAGEGRVQYAWQAGDTDDIGRYLADVVVTWPGDEQQTFPPQGTFSWFVHPTTGITWRDVVGVASELASVDEEVQFNILAYVNGALAVDEFGGEGSAMLKLARVYLAAHMATIGPASSGAAIAGPVISESAGGLSRTYALVGSVTTGSFDSSSYGRAFSDLVRRSTARAPRGF